MQYRFRELKKNSTVQVSGPLDIMYISGLKEALVESLDMATESIEFRPNSIKSDSYACLQLLCSICKSSFTNGKGFHVKGKHAGSVFKLAMDAGFPSRMCREKKCGSCCLMGSDGEKQKNC